MKISWAYVNDFFKLTFLAPANVSMEKIADENKSSVFSTLIY